MSVTTSLIVAVARNGVIGRHGQLPWRMPSDLKTFRRLTMGKPIVMGRKTFESIGRPLDGRDNIVITRNPHFEAEGVSVFNDVAEALVLARALARTNGSDEVMVIGGADIFVATLPDTQRVYWTEIAGEPEGDVHFPALDPAAWHEFSSEPINRGPRDEYDAVLRIFERTPT
ncbi:MAG: dihydrofolate reductase [Hyphomicrobium sp.]